MQPAQNHPADNAPFEKNKRAIKRAYLYSTPAIICSQSLDNLQPDY